MKQIFFSKLQLKIRITNTKLQLPSFNCLIESFPDGQHVDGRSRAVHLPRASRERIAAKSSQERTVGRELQRGSNLSRG